jgi:hypothetical protein
MSRPNLNGTHVMSLSVSDSPASMPDDALIAITSGPSRPGERGVNRAFGTGPAVQELVSSINAPSARNFVSAHRADITAAAKQYDIDEMVLANVLYQEARHAGPDDFMQDRVHPRSIPDRLGADLESGNLGPGQLSVQTFRDLVKTGQVQLSGSEWDAYQTDPDFSRNFLINPETGIRATAALISNRLTKLEYAHLIPNTGRDGDPATLDLNQFIYGAALYSAGGRTTNDAFDRNGPDPSHISFAQNDISGLNDLPNADKLMFSFHYLGETYEALYGREAPAQLGDYFRTRP